MHEQQSVDLISSLNFDWWAEPIVTHVVLL